MPAKLDKCVADVKAKGGADNPWAVCNASIGKETKEEADILEKKTREKSYPWGQCQADQAKAGHDKDSANKICGSIKAEIVEAIIREHVGDNEFLIKGKPEKKRVNANRQVPVFHPPITNRKVEPQINKTTKGIGGQVGKIDSNSNTNNMATNP